ATVLQSAGSDVHVQLLRMYEWRIEEALTGRAPHGLFPDGIQPPARAEVPARQRLAEYQEASLVSYNVGQRYGRSRILDPEGCVNVYAEWTLQREAGWVRQLSRLHVEHDPAEIDRRVRSLLREADAFTPSERLR